MAPPLIPIEQRFWSHVERRGPDECWVWIGHRNPKGYGRVAVTGSRKSRPAQRVAWELSNGQPFPEGKLGCHSCDNPPCCNPAHIWPGSHADNVADAIQKGRFVQNLWGRRRAVLTHCHAGHEFTPENTYESPCDGRRRCRTCNRAAVARFAARKRAISQKEQSA